MKPETCDRCESTIVSGRFEKPFVLPPKPTGEENTFETDEARLCSVCVTELYEWVAGDGVNRSECVDPVSLNRLEKNVNRHIEELQAIKDSIQP